MVRRLLYMIACMAPPALWAGGVDVADSLGPAFKSLADTAQISRLIQEAAAKRVAHPAWAWEYVELGIETANKNEDYRKGDLVLLRGTLQWSKADNEGALVDYTEARRLFSAKGDSVGMAKADNNLGLVYWSMSYFDLALEAHLQALRYFERHPDTLRLSTLYNNIGNIYSRTRDNDQAAAFYRKAYDMLEPQGNSPSLCMVANNLGLVLVDLGRTPEALRLYEQALSGYREFSDSTGQVSVLNNLGSAYIKQERFQEAKSAYDQALEIALLGGNDFDIAVAYLKVAEYLVKTNAFAEAIAPAQKALDFGKGPNTLVQLAAAHSTLAAAYEGTGDFENALIHQKAFQNLQDSVFSEGKSRAVAELQLKYNTAVKDQQIERLDKEGQLAQLRTVILLVVLALILVSAVLIFLRQRAILRREKLIKEKDKAMFETQAALHDAERRVSEAEKQRLQDDLSFKSREITTLAMNIVRKNELLESLDGELRQFRKTAKDGSEDKIREISLLLAQNLSSEKERKEIELFIDEAQQNFFLELDRRFPDISIKDKRLCVMIRQGLSSKDIATVFNINTASVEVSRYRLRKKLNLDANQDLQAFLGEF